MNVHIISDETKSRVLRILEVIQGHLYRLHYLLENSQWLTELAHINHEHECWTQWLASLVSLRSCEFVGAV